LLISRGSHLPLVPGVNKRSVAPDAMLGLENSLIDGGTTALDVTKKLVEKAKAKAAADEDDKGYHINLIMPQFSPDVSGAMNLTQNFNAGAQDLQSKYLQLFGTDAVVYLHDAQQRVDQLKDQMLAEAPTPAAANLAGKPSANGRMAQSPSSIVMRRRNNGSMMTISTTPRWRRDVAQSVCSLTTTRIT
jgi:hypothetical protein